ncbi:MAG: hypothetical protein O3A01_02705 [bacterium]|nr:hypothetical protein [bacterium]
MFHRVAFQSEHRAHLSWVQNNTIVDFVVGTYSLRGDTLCFEMAPTEAYLLGLGVTPQNMDASAPVIRNLALGGFAQGLYAIGEVVQKWRLENRDDDVCEQYAKAVCSLNSKHHSALGYVAGKLLARITDEWVVESEFIHYPQVFCYLNVFDTNLDQAVPGKDFSIKDFLSGRVKGVSGPKNESLSLMSKVSHSTYTVMFNSLPALQLLYDFQQKGPVQCVIAGNGFRAVPVLGDGDSVHTGYVSFQLQEVLAVLSHNKGSSCVGFDSLLSKFETVHEFKPDYWARNFVSQQLSSLDEECLAQQLEDPGFVSRLLNPTVIHDVQRVLPGTKRLYADNVFSDLQIQFMQRMGESKSAPIVVVMTHFLENVLSSSMGSISALEKRVMTWLDRAFRKGDSILLMAHDYYVLCNLCPNWQSIFKWENCHALKALPNTDGKPSELIQQKGVYSNEAVQLVRY